VKRAEQACATPARRRDEFTFSGRVRFVAEEPRTEAEIAAHDQKWLALLPVKNGSRA
jgi:hypothetical protein